MSKRREISAQFKVETVLEGLRGEKRVAQICRERDMTDSLYDKWRDELMENARGIITDKRRQGTDASSEGVAELERLVGGLTMELAIAKKSGGLAGIMVEGKRAMIAQLKDAYPVERTCAVLDCPRRSYDDVPSGGDDTELVEVIEQVLLRKPFFGYRRIAAQLKGEGHTVTTKVVRRLLKELGLPRKVGQVRIRPSDSSHPHWRYPNLVQGWQPIQPDSVWVADVT